MEENKYIISDKEKCLEYLKNTDGAFIKLDHISENLKYDPDIMKNILMKNQTLINDFSDKIMDMDYSKVLDDLFDTYGAELLTRISPELKENPKFMIKMVKSYPATIYSLKEPLKNDLNFKVECQNVIEDVVKEYKEKGYDTGWVNATKNSITNENINFAEEKLGLTKEQFELLRHYPDTLKKLSNIGNSEKSPIFSSCLKNINGKNLELTEWTNELNNLMDKFGDKNYQELLSNIDAQNINIEKLNKVLEQPNYFNIKNQEEVEKYQDIKEEVCDAIISENQKKITQYPLIEKMNETERLKFAVLEKLVGYDVKQANDIKNRYLCIDEVEANDTNDIKSWVASMKEITNENNKDTLKELYSLEPLPAKAQDKSVLEQEAKALYMQEYNKTLFRPENGEKMSNEELANYLPSDVDKDKYKFINAGTEFNMIMTAVGAYYHNSYSDYAKSWNREITNSKGFSCSYIGNDMIATAPINDVCYGFSKMENDSLLLSGSCNLGSATNPNELVVDKTYVDYQRPQDLKENTMDYNEMVFKREQNGERKQPDYLLVFKNGEKIPNMERTLKAVDDFKKEGIDLPIVVVDVERCIESEKSKVENMIKEAEEKNDPELWKEADKKLRTNSKTTAVRNSNIFRGCYDKLNSIYKQVFTNEIKNEKVEENIYKESYEQTGPEERKEEVSKIVQLQRKIMSIIKGKEVNGNER